MGECTDYPQIGCTKLRFEDCAGKSIYCVDLNFVHNILLEIFLMSVPTSFLTSYFSALSCVVIFLAATMEDRRKLIPKSMFSQHVKEMHEKREKGFEDEYAVS